MDTLQPPEDKAVTTLYLGGLEAGVTDKEVRDQFYVHGEIRSIRMVPRQCCAFVTFATREGAEEAASKTHRILTIRGKKVNVMWGRPQQRAANPLMAVAASGSAAGSATAPADAPTGNVYRPYYPS